MGGEVFALIVFAAIGIALWRSSDSVSLPVVVTFILGSIVITELPGGAVRLVGIVAVLSITIGVYLMTQRTRARL